MEAVERAAMLRAYLEKWENTGETTHFWTLIDGNLIDEVRQVLIENPEWVHMRSEDGRGPLFWAYEYGRAEIVDLLLEAGADENAKDASGLTARQLIGQDGRKQEEEDENEEEIYEGKDLKIHKYSFKLPHR